MTNSKYVLSALIFGLFGSLTTAAEKKPAMIVSTDGYPAGNATPEGAACDLARAFIEADVKLFKKTPAEHFNGVLKQRNCH